MSTQLAKVEGPTAPKARIASEPTKGKTKKAAPRKPVLKVTMEAKAAGVVKEECPDGLPTKYWIKSTFNTSDIMHSPVEKTLRMLDKILSGERLFTM
jgi:hypothetical protein